MKILGIRFAYLYEQSEGFDTSSKEKKIHKKMLQLLKDVVTLIAILMVFSSYDYKHEFGLRDQNCRNSCPSRFSLSAAMMQSPDIFIASQKILIARYPDRSKQSNIANIPW